MFVTSNPHRGEPLTGKPDAGNPPVRFGGRGDRTQSVLPTPIDYRLPITDRLPITAHPACSDSCAKNNPPDTDTTFVPEFPMPCSVQISLDLHTIDDALHVAQIAADSGVDWLEAGTPLMIEQGMGAVRALRARFPNHPIVCDFKVCDGGGLFARLAG